MGLRGFSTLNYWADDVAAASAWYARVLGVEPYFTRPGPDGGLAYAKFRAGDHQAELAIAHRSFVPPGAGLAPGGAVMHWQVDDVEATMAQLLSMGARQYQPVTPHGPILTASVVDPFGNLLGIIHNPHYLAVLAATTNSGAAGALREDPVTVPAG
jgi:catechol 2,3-dioxygenase-like lactoylglutathione lyase family enzyme